MEDSLDDYLKVSRNTKQETPLRISQELLITAQRKKECEARALQIVQFSIEGKLAPEVLVNCLPHINQEQYQDIVEERAIDKLCGYPICGGKIPEMPKKQYHISRKTNQVYDITERKNYCRNHCYKASTHLKKQIEKSPLWLRKAQDVKKFNLLSESEGGLPGELIDQGIIAKPVLEPEFTSISSFAQISLGDLEANEMNSQKNNKSNGKRRKRGAQNLGTISEDNENRDEEKGVKEEQSSNKKREIKKKEVSEKKGNQNKEENRKKEVNKNKEENEEKEKTQKTDQKKEINKNKVLTKEKIEIDSEVSKKFKEWITLDTLIFVHGEEKIKSFLSHQKLCEYFEKLKITELQTENQRKYIELCKKLHLKHLADEKLDRRILGGKNSILKPIPDYKALKEESQNLDIKVKSFYGGALYDQEDKNFPTKITNKIQEEEEEEQAMVLPVAENSTMALRRRVLLENLHRPMHALLRDLRISPNLQTRDLLKTFHLTAHNVYFKPKMWKFVAVTILKILAFKDVELKKMLDEEKEAVELILDTLTDKGQFVNEILEIILDIDKFVTNFVARDQ